VAIPPELRNGDYARDPAFRKSFQHWLQALWREKDDQIDALTGLPAASRPPEPA
jgi:hypothetical protein